MSNSNVAAALGLSTVQGLQGFGTDLSNTSSAISTGSLLSDSINYNSPLHDIFIQAEQTADRAQPIIQNTQDVAKQQALANSQETNQATTAAMQILQTRDQLFQHFGNNLENLPTSVAQSLGYKDGPTLFSSVFGQASQSSSSSDSSSSPSSSTSTSSSSSSSQSETGTQQPQSLNAGSGLSGFLGSIF